MEFFRYKQVPNSLQDDVMRSSPTMPEKKNAPVGDGELVGGGGLRAVTFCRHDPWLWSGSAAALETARRTESLRRLRPRVACYFGPNEAAGCRNPELGPDAKAA